MAYGHICIPLSQIWEELGYMSWHCLCPFYDKAVFKDKGACGGQKYAICDKGMQICPDATILSPPAKLPPGKRATASSSFPSARILLPSVFKKCSWEGAAHWMVSAFLMLAALAETRHKEERCSSTYSTSWNRYISADSEISCFLALYRPLSTIAILPPCWKTSACVDGKITTQKSAKSKTKKYSAKVFLPHFLLSPSSAWCH